MTRVASAEDLGVGIGLRRDHFATLFDQPPGSFDFLEVLTENFAGFGGRAREVLARCAERFPIVLHGVALSIGSLDPLDPAYLDGVAELVARTGARWWSDHLCFASAHGVEYHDLVPLPFTREAVDHVAARIHAVRKRVDAPFLLENPSTYLRWPTAPDGDGAEAMDEAAFFRAVVEAGDCGILLDVNNVFVNATNHGYDARAFIDALPLERVAQIHLAGHTVRPDIVIDSHAEPVRDEVLDLYAYTIARTGPVATLLEWDHRIPPIATMLGEVARIRAARARGIDAAR
ncbi:MAG: DUF692 domain-containing protein [Myxococcota bacterium]